ncbi:hypothetical protein BHM03_00033024 [Ensete ventricosum]|nr:hypothetical protein BHM03_00033024 [Ensete ventricosum]
MAASNVAVLLLLAILSSAFTTAHGQILHNGRWKLLKRSIGISAMHVALLPNGKVIVFDRTDFGASNISLPSERCRNDPRDQALRHDCWAHSVEFEPLGRSVRPLTVLTDTWCSAGALTANGTLVQTGGFNDGERAVRYFSPCDGCDWVEDEEGLAVKRWYASAHVLPDGRRVIVVGGRGQFDYEFVPKEMSSGAASTFELPFLRETKNASENNLYPFIHLSPDGNLFIFADTKAILLDYEHHRVVRRFPEMPGGISRNYPSTGSSVLLPILLQHNVSGAIEAEVMICGGAMPNASSLAAKGRFLPASNTCGRLKITDESPEWTMEKMPMGRVMGDMVLLPTGDVLIVNGAGRGSAGWYMGREPVLHPVLYRSGVAGVANRGFKVLNPTTTPRVYHSTAHLLPDGRVLVGGSNPNIKYEFSGVMFPTELSLEAFYPPYLGAPRRPRITGMKPGTEITYGERLSIEAQLEEGVGEEVVVTMVAPAFTTHSFSMNQRLLVLEVGGVRRSSSSSGCYVVEVVAPASAVLAPRGYYMVFVVQEGVPSRGRWIHVM